MQLTHSLSVSKDMPLVCVETAARLEIASGGGVVWTEAEVDESQIWNLGEAKQISWGPVDRPLASQRLCACKRLGVVDASLDRSHAEAAANPPTLARKTPDYSAERHSAPESWGKGGSMSAYAPFLPSPLSISSSSSPPPPDPWQPPSSDPMLPSSPTPKSAADRERERDRPNSNPRAAAYKSQLSTRRPPPHPSASSSSSNSSSPTPFGSSPSALSTRTRRAAQENSRAARMQVLRRYSSRGLPLLTTGDGGVRDEPGGWVDGEWEEFDDDEKVGLELEMRKARREFEWRQRKLDELASEQGFLLEEEEPEPEDDMMTEPGKFTRSRGSAADR